MKKWTEELIKVELLKSISVLGINRMPTTGELKLIGRNDLHCQISRTKMYSGWASELGLELKRSETKMGKIYEGSVMQTLEKYGYEVKRMSTRHPYDLLINDVTKIDVKSANPYLLRGYRYHTFGLAKPEQTCDIYICVCLDENGKEENVLIIPSHHISSPTLSVGPISKYRKYKDCWYYIKQYTEFFKTVM